MAFVVAGSDAWAARRAAGEAVWAAWEARMGPSVSEAELVRAFGELEIGFYGGPATPEAARVFGPDDAEAWARGGAVAQLLGLVRGDPLGVWLRGFVGSVWLDAQLAGDNRTRKTRVCLSLSDDVGPMGSPRFRLTLMPWYFDGDDC